MTLPIVINPDAEADLAEARAWYDLQRVGLGDDLLEQVSHVFDQISRRPLLYATVFDNLRFAPVVRFPFEVIYRVDDDQITIIAVYHSRRDPQTWKEDDFCNGATGKSRETAFFTANLKKWQPIPNYCQSPA